MRGQKIWQEESGCKGKGEQIFSYKKVSRDDFQRKEDEHAEHVEDVLHGGSREREPDQQRGSNIKNKCSPHTIALPRMSQASMSWLIFPPFKALTRIKLVKQVCLKKRKSYGSCRAGFEPETSLNRECQILDIA